MKIFKLIYIIILCSIMNTAYSKDALCGAIAAPSNRINQELMVMSRGNGTVCVNVFFHIVRNDNGTEKSIPEIISNKKCGF